MTFTRTHTLTKTPFADPFKVCNECGGWIDGVLDPPRGMFLTSPCRHTQGYTDVCPSWGPVDGCACAEFGMPEHPRPKVLDEEARLREQLAGAVDALEQIAALRDAADWTRPDSRVTQATRVAGDALRELRGR